MTKHHPTAAVAAPPAIVAEAWQQVGASFDRFCLASGVAALQTMMGRDCDSPLWSALRSQGRLQRPPLGGVPRASSASTAARSRSIIQPVRERGGQEGVALPSWETAQAEDWLGRWALNLMLINV